MTAWIYAVLEIEGHKKAESEHSIHSVGEFERGADIMRHSGKGRGSTDGMLRLDPP